MGDKRKNSSLVNQPVVNSVECKFKAIGNAELIENIMQVVLYGLFADEELFADFSVAKSLSDKLNDFFFTIAEQRLLATLVGFCGFLEGIDHFGGHTVVEPDFSIENFANAFH